jgi:hypothetical protein
MSNNIVPFGGIYGWLAELTVAANKRSRTGFSILSYYVAEANKQRALAAIRVHAGAKDDAPLVARRALSVGELHRLGMKPGDVLCA